MITIIFDQFWKTLKKTFHNHHWWFLISLNLNSHSWQIFSHNVRHTIHNNNCMKMSTVTDGSTISLSTTISQSLHHRHSVHQHTVLLPLEKCGWCYNCNKLVSWPVSDNNSRHGPHLAPWCHSAFYCFRGRAGQDNYYKSRLFVDWSVFLLQAILCLILRSNTSHTRPLERMPQQVWSIILKSYSIRDLIIQLLSYYHRHPSFYKYGLLETKHEFISELELFWTSFSITKIVHLF